MDPADKPRDVGSLNLMAVRAGERELDKSVMRQRAKNLRTQSTDTENHLWYYLRVNRLGFKFKRQVPIGNYIVDFVCNQKRLIIELGGGQHSDNQRYDIERTA